MSLSGAQRQLQRCRAEGLVIEAQKMRERGWSELWGWVGLLALLLLSGCAGSESETEVLLVVDSDLAVGRELTAVVVGIYDRAGKNKLREQRLTLTDDAEKASGTRFLLPLSLSLVAPSQDSTLSFRVVVTGLGPVGSAQGQPVVEQQAILGFRPRARGRLDVFLGYRCLNQLCPDGNDPPELTCDPSNGDCDPVRELSDLPKADGDGVMDFTLPDGVERRKPDGGMDAAMDAEVPSCTASEVPDGQGGCKPAGVCADSAKHNCDTDPLACVPGVAPDSFECVCPNGYKGSGRGENGCLDINECEAATPVCDADPKAICVNSPGSYECTCPDGYMGNGRGANGCEDVLECEDNNGGCDSLTTCNEVVGGPPTCGACPAGYGGTGEQGCTPQLLDLGLQHGTLVPAFDPAVTSYKVKVPLWVQSTRLTPMAPTDSSIRVSGSALASGEPSQELTLRLGDTAVPVIVSAGGHGQTTYTVTLTRGNLEAYVKASNTEIEDYFGYSVAIDGDTLAVGASGEDSGIVGEQDDNSANHSGAVYIFTRSGTTWSQQAYLKASNVDANDSFGQSVALDGDTLAVGAVDESSGATGVGGNQADNAISYSGAVYVFTRSGSVWSQQAYVKASNTGGFDQFGTSVALSGDTLAVGAPGEASSASGVGANQANDSAGGSGAAYVFHRTGTTWSQQAYVKASNPEEYDRFGESIALSGDTLAVGAPSEDSSATGVGGDESDNNADSSGAVYVFTRSGNLWSEEAYVKASNTEAYDFFGDCVALDGDTLAIGARGENSGASGVGGDQVDNSAEQSGAVYVFTRYGSVWSQEAYLKASNTGELDAFGDTVALQGDTLVVGAPGEASGLAGEQADNTAGRSGAVYLFTRSDATWSQQAYLKASNSEAQDNFGSSVSLAGNTFAVGARFESGGASGVGGDQTDNSAPVSGAVYLY